MAVAPACGASTAARRGDHRPGCRRRPALPCLVTADHWTRSRASSGWRWPTASTGATTARRCARRTAAKIGPGQATGTVVQDAAWVPVLEMLELVRRGAARAFRPLVRAAVASRATQTQRTRRARQHRDPGWLRVPRCVVVWRVTSPIPTRCCGLMPLGRPAGSGGSICSNRASTTRCRSPETSSAPAATESVGVRHLLVTNDFPPKLGGIQSYLWELWRRLPAGRCRGAHQPVRG